MPLKIWSSERDNSLIDYLDSHVADFQDKALRKSAVQAAANHINRQFKLDNLFGAQQIINKINNIARENPGVTAERIYQEGSACLPNFKHKNQPSSQADENTGTTTNGSCSPVTPETTQLSIPMRAVPDHKDVSEKDFLRGCTECLKKDREIERLNTSIELLTSSTSLTSDQNLLPQRIGPKDSQVRDQMQEMAGIVSTIVVDFKETPPRQITFPRPKVLEKRFSALHGLMLAVYGIAKDGQLPCSDSSFGFRPLNNEVMLRSLIGIATMKSAFDVPFPEQFSDKDIVLQRYHAAIRKECGTFAEIRIRQSALESFIKEGKQGLHLRASEEAGELADKLLPLLLDDAEENSVFLHHKSKQHPSWHECVDNMRLLFEKAFLLCARLKLNLLDSHSFFWPRPGDLYDAECMTTGDINYVPVEEQRVQITLFPGILASLRSDIPFLAKDVEKIRQMSHRSTNGDILAPALVFL